MTERGMDDPELVNTLAASFLRRRPGEHWQRPHEKAALTRARRALKVIKHWLERSA